ncbi:MAG: hypothetical protein DRR08_08535 [Candidatus Parabeggiatoa sp. nov. 2]|nr:MAG: hypothetical protein B6247_01935 [Beggiatoa sp. 4572_84]RKZ61506.1 MAG: hypothetical protein DRR08_08535 [Gammaproteobacteria bacterium]
MTGFSRRPVLTWHCQTKKSAIFFEKKRQQSLDSSGGCQTKVWTEVAAAKLKTLLQDTVLKKSAKAQVEKHEPTDTIPLMDGICRWKNRMLLKHALSQSGLSDSV